MTHPPLTQLIPHQGIMSLHERVLAWDERHVRLATTTHASAANPLRRAGRLHALHLGEYGAQAMAVHGGLIAHAAGGVAPPGLLVALRGVAWTRERIDDLAGELVTEAEQLIAAADSQQYAFRVLHDAREIASGRAAVMLRRAP